MFTGIITDIGKIISISNTDHRLIKIGCSYDENDIDILLSTKRKDYILAAQIKNKVNVSHIMRLGISRPILKRDFIQRYIISNQVDGIIVNAIALKKELLSYKFIKRNFNSDRPIYNTCFFTSRCRRYGIRSNCGYCKIF